MAFSLFLFLDGRIGEFFSEVSAVVMLTLLISLIEALIILPAHLAHSKALLKQEKMPKNFVSKVFKKLRDFNKIGDKLMKFMRDKFYLPVLDFSLKNRFLIISMFLGLFSLTIGSFGGGIIRTSFFPSIASDKFH